MNNKTKTELITIIEKQEEYINLIDSPCDERHWQTQDCFDEIQTLREEIAKLKE